MVSLIFGSLGSQAHEEWSRLMALMVVLLGTWRRERNGTAVGEPVNFSDEISAIRKLEEWAETRGVPGARRQHTKSSLSAMKEQRIELQESLLRYAGLGSTEDKASLSCLPIIPAREAERRRASEA